MRLCIPVIAKTTREARMSMGSAFATPGFSELLWELRVDGIGDLDIGSLLSKREKRVIVTNRRKEEGGAFRGAEEERVRILREAVVSGADFVDIEASTAPELVESLREEIAHSGGASRLIVSSHDWMKTPSDRSLKRRLAECVALGADVVKVVTMARAPEDNLKVLSLIPHARKEGIEVIAFCMGLEGRISRIFSPLLGAYLCFAAAGEGETSAPGQMTVKEMVEALRLIRTPLTLPLSPAPGERESQIAEDGGHNFLSPSLERRGIRESGISNYPLSPRLGGEGSEMTEAAGQDSCSSSSGREIQDSETSDRNPLSPRLGEREG